MHIKMRHPEYMEEEKEKQVSDGATVLVLREARVLGLIITVAQIRPCQLEAVSVTEGFVWLKRQARQGVHSV